MKSDKGTESAAFITSRDTLDGAYPGLVLGINSVRLGMETMVFYTFMGINVIRKGWAEKAKFQPPGFMGAIPGMSAAATWMMKSKIRKASIPCLGDLRRPVHRQMVHHLLLSEHRLVKPSPQLPGG